MAESTRVGDTYTPYNPQHQPERFKAAALGAIADELRKLRLLREYELDVLVGDDGDSTLQVVAASSDDPDHHKGALRGEPVFDEDQGAVAL